MRTFYVVKIVKCASCYKIKPSRVFKYSIFYCKTKKSTWEFYAKGITCINENLFLFLAQTVVLEYLRSTQTALTYMFSLDDSIKHIKGKKKALGKLGSN